MNMIDDRAIDVDEIRGTYTNGDPGDSFHAAMGDDPLSDGLVENFNATGNDAVVISDEDEAVAGLEEDDEVQEEGSDQEAVEAEEDEEPQEMIAQPQPKASRKRPKRTLFSNARNRGQKRKSPSAEPESSAMATKKGKGKAQPVSQDIDDSQLSIGSSKRGKGRPKKESVVYQDSDSDNPPPPKKAKRGPKPKDPNAKMSARQSKKVEEFVEEMKGRPRRPHNLYILRRETPADDSVTHTRSGRTSVRPLAYWRNERCIYGNGEAAEGERFPLATIKEVIRNDEVEVPEYKREKGRGRGKRRRARQGTEDEEEETDEELDIWEEEPGIMSQEVFRWDSQLQEAIDVSETVGKFSLVSANSLLMSVRCRILSSSH